MTLARTPQVTAPATAEAADSAQAVTTRPDSPTAATARSLTAEQRAHAETFAIAHQARAGP